MCCVENLCIQGAATTSSFWAFQVGDSVLGLVSMDYAYAVKQRFDLTAFDQIPFGSIEETPFVSVDMVEFGVDPHMPTKARPGSDEKVLMLAARYAAGLPLWHEEDCADHSDTVGTEDDSELEGTYSFSEFEDEFHSDECELVGEID